MDTRIRGSGNVMRNRAVQCERVAQSEGTVPSYWLGAQSTQCMKSTGLGKKKT